MLTSNNGFQAKAQKNQVLKETLKKQLADPNYWYKTSAQQQLNKIEQDEADALWVKNNPNASLAQLMYPSMRKSSTAQTQADKGNNTVTNSATQTPTKFYPESFGIRKNEETETVQKLRLQEETATSSFSTKPTSFSPESFGTKPESIQNPAQNEVTNLPENQELSNTEKILEVEPQQSANIQEEQIERLTAVSKLSAEIGNLSPELGVLTEILGTAGEMGEKGNLGGNNQENQNERHIYEPHLGYTHIASPESSAETLAESSQKASSQKASLNQERDAEREVMLQQLASEREENPYAVQELINNGEFVAFNESILPDSLSQHFLHQKMQDSNPKRESLARYFSAGYDAGNDVNQTQKTAKIFEDMSISEKFMYQAGESVSVALDSAITAGVAYYASTVGVSVAKKMGVSCLASATYALSKEVIRQIDNGEEINVQQAFNVDSKNFSEEILAIGGLKIMQPVMRTVNRLSNENTKMFFTFMLEMLNNALASLGSELGHEGDIDMEDTQKAFSKALGKRIGGSGVTKELE